MWPYGGMNPQQPFIIMPPWPGNQPQSPTTDPYKTHRKVEKWIKKYQEEQKKAAACAKKPEAPKTGREKFFGEKSQTYWDVMKFVIAFGPIGTYVWAMLVVYMTRSFLEALSTIPH